MQAAAFIGAFASALSRWRRRTTTPSAVRAFMRFMCPMCWWRRCECERWRQKA